MKKGIIAISLLLTGVLLITPITNAISQNDVVKDVTPIAVEQVTKDDENNTTQTEEQTTFAEKENTVLDAEIENKVSENKIEETPSTEEVKEDIKEDANNEKEESAVEEQVTIEESKDEEVKTGMTKSEAEAIVNKYIQEVEKGDFTYTYQGDENTFEVIREKGIRGYVFLPNVETDMAYLVDKDTGNIYYFHPSGYFELLQ